MRDPNAHGEKGEALTVRSHVLAIQRMGED